MSCKEKIEQTSEIGKLEMQWLRGKPGELFPFVAERHERFVKAPVSPDQRFRTRIHTHICNKDIKATPSLGDLIYILIDIGKSNIRNWHIASVSKIGEVEGYVCMSATSQLTKKVKDSDDGIQKLWDEVYYGYFWFGLPKDRTEDQVMLELLEKFKTLGLSIKIIPMESYVFNGQRFVNHL